MIYYVIIYVAYNSIIQSLCRCKGVNGVCTHSPYVAVPTHPITTCTCIINYIMYVAGLVMNTTPGLSPVVNDSPSYNSLALFSPSCHIV